MLFQNTSFFAASVVKFLCFLAVLPAVSANSFTPTSSRCIKETYEDVLKAMEENTLPELGINKEELKRRILLGDDMSRKALYNTWATSLTPQEYQAIHFPYTRPTKETSQCFGAPHGEVNGGYGCPVDTGFDLLDQWADRTRESAFQAYYYLYRQIGARYPRFRYLLPDNPSKDKIMGSDGNEHTFDGLHQSTHAELKLLIRLMAAERAVERKPLFITISRHMCRYCVDVVSLLARLRDKPIFAVAPRPREIAEGSEISESFMYFKEDGYYFNYKRNPNGGDEFNCWEGWVDNVPEEFDSSYIRPQAPPVDMFTSGNRMIMSNAADEIFNLDSRQHLPSHYIQHQLSPATLMRDYKLSTNSRHDMRALTKGNCFAIGEPKCMLSCPPSEKMTGIHGSAWGGDSLSKHAVLKSVGLFCSKGTKVEAKGFRHGIMFELRCPHGHEMSGLIGSFGHPTSNVGIVCRSNEDRSQLVSILSGFPEADHGVVECEQLTTGTDLGYEHGVLGIRGLGMCCA